MNITTAYSVSSIPRIAVQDLQNQLAGFDANLVIFFASSALDPEGISREMQAAFPLADVFGCSTAGEIVTGRMLTNSVVAMAFNGQAVRSAKIAVLEDLNRDSYEAFSSFERHFDTPMAAMDPNRYVGIVLVDGLCLKEELIIDRIGDLTNVNFIGGSAGDDLKFAATHVYANGKSYRNAAVLALIEPATDFTFVKTQSFRALDKKLVVTKANAFAREVMEFDNKPAAVAYAEALGTSVAEAPERFMHNPVGLMIGDEPYVRSPQQIKGEKMAFYCGVAEGMELTLLESTDIIQDTSQALARAKAELGRVSGVINFNCILRTLELGQKHLTDQYASLFAEVPTVGFSTYGEQFIGHINQTATMLVFK